MKKSKTVYVCSECGHESPKWAGQCTECKAWNTLVESVAQPDSPNAGGNRFDAWAGATGKAVDLKAVKGLRLSRTETGIGELDRVLGGGLVRGSVLLLGGEPGVGKSTLLLQAAARLGERMKVLYATGEESAEQVALRAQRLGLAEADMKLLAEIELEKILHVLREEKPDFVIIDSVQTAYSAALQSAPGTVAQVRECAAHLTRYAKQTQASLVMVGHVTKEGDLAGPRVLEHMVDTVLSFEGEPGSPFRMVRAFKNRFGSASEMGVFAMSEQGLVEVSNPSALFLTAHEKPVAGSSVLAAMQGNRPFLVEVQALSEDAAGPNPRRFSQGIEVNRLQMLLAILSRHSGTTAIDQNVYLRAAAGVRLTEPAADLAALLAVHSSLTGRPLPSQLAVFGEVGLAGELRPVPGAQERIREAAKLGFKQVLLPAGNAPAQRIAGVDLLTATRLEAALGLVRELRQAA